MLWGKITRARSSRATGSNAHWAALRRFRGNRPTREIRVHPVADPAPFPSASSSRETIPESGPNRCFHAKTQRPKVEKWPSGSFSARAGRDASPRRPRVGHSGGFGEPALPDRAQSWEHTFSAPPSAAPVNAPAPHTPAGGWHRASLRGPARAKPRPFGQRAA